MTMRFVSPKGVDNMLRLIKDKVPPPPEITQLKEEITYNSIICKWSGFSSYQFGNDFEVLENINENKGGISDDQLYWISELVKHRGSIGISIKELKSLV